MPADIIDSLKNLLGDDAEDKIRTVLSSLGADNPKPAPPPDTDNTINLDAIENLAKFKSIAEKLGNTDDSRSRLLTSLKPFMRGERQQSIDTAIKLLNLSKFSDILNI